MLPPPSAAAAPTLPHPLCSHHICLEVDDIGASVAHVGARVRLLDAKPKVGPEGGG